MVGVTGLVCKEGGVDGKEDGEDGVVEVMVLVMVVARVVPPRLRVIKQAVDMEVVILEDR